MRSCGSGLPRHDGRVSDDVVVIHTDGGCTPNPGPGGWGVWLRSGEHAKELWGGERHTTNNRMEMNTKKKKASN